VLLPKIVVSGAPEQTYALYLPTSYSPAKRWPIVYVFSPDAHGEIPTALMQSAAEQFGYIVAASNNSKNGPWKPDALAAQALMNDTTSRLSVDSQRLYFAGFSGGARVAAHLAQLCKCASTLFLNGAGFPTALPPTRAHPFAVFLTAGLLDFNYPEVTELDSQLESLGYLHFFRRFDGGHQWAPSEIWPEAFAWADLLAMQTNRLQPDDSFVAAQLARFLATAQKFEQDGEPYFSWQFLRSVARAFAGLTDLSILQQHIAALQANPAVRAGQKRETQEIDEQQSLQDGVFNLFAGLNSAADRYGVIHQTTQEVVRLRERAAGEKDPEQRRVAERARRGVFAYFIEHGEPLLDSGDLPLARTYLALAAEARPDSPWPQVSLARCDLKSGRRKDALRDLRQAVAAGLTAADLSRLLSDFPEFGAFASDPEFQKIAAAAFARSPSN
jgi:dienelactone hydrolase